jgi:hypothetical protein
MTTTKRQKPNGSCRKDGGRSKARVQETSGLFDTHLDSGRDRDGDQRAKGKGKSSESQTKDGRRTNK